MRMPNRSGRLLTALTVAIGLVLGGRVCGDAAHAADEPSAPAQLAPDDSAQEQRGLTRPNETRELAIVTRGVIAKVLVKEGDPVKAGQLLLQQDVRMEQLKLQGLQIQAASDTEIHKAEQELDLADAQYKNVASAASGVYAPIDLKTKQVEYEVAKLKLQDARDTKELKKLDADSQSVLIDMMSTRSPIDGVVAKLDIGVGEISDPGKPASITIVQNDPLKVEAMVQTAVAASLKVGQSASVRYVNETQWRPATIIFLSPVVSAGGLRMVKLTMPNPILREAGREVRVRFDAPAQPTADAARSASNAAAPAPTAQAPVE